MFGNDHGNDCVLGLEKVMICCEPIFEDRRKIEACNSLLYLVSIQRVCPWHNLLDLSRLDVQSRDNQSRLIHSNLPWPSPTNQHTHTKTKPFPLANWEWYHKWLTCGWDPVWRQCYFSSNWFEIEWLFGWLVAFLRWWHNPCSTKKTGVKQEPNKFVLTGMTTRWTRTRRSAQILLLLLLLLSVTCAHIHQYCHLSYHHHHPITFNNILAFSQDKTRHNNNNNNNQNYPCLPTPPRNGIHPTASNFER